MVLTQKSTYPFDSVVEFDVKTSQVREFAMSFRIPEWAEGASISVNGRRVQTPTSPGSLASVHHQWSTGDRVELDLPMTMRIEPFDPQHPQTVALLFGPLVLFAITDAQPVLTRAELLAASRSDQQTWQIKTASGPIKMLPFTAIDEEQYSTYLSHLDPAMRQTA